MRFWCSCTCQPWKHSAKVSISGPITQSTSLCRISTLKHWQQLEFLFRKLPSLNWISVQSGRCWLATQKFLDYQPRVLFGLSSGNLASYRSLVRSQGLIAAIDLWEWLPERLSAYRFLTHACRTRCRLGHHKWHFREYRILSTKQGLDL